jgi:hypothetical protein
MIAWLIIGTLLCAATCYFIAKSRSADTVFWTVMGLLLGPIAIPFAFFSKPVKRDPRVIRGS